MLQFVEHFDRQTSTNVSKAVGLFRFLEAVQAMRSRTTRNTADFAKPLDAAVIWLDEIADHPLVRLNADDPDAPLLSVRRGSPDASSFAGYEDLFAVSLSTQTRAEDLELVLGIGLLAYAPAGLSPVRRHMLTLPVRLDLDEHTGRIDLRPEASSVLTSEVERFLEPSAIADPRTLNRLEFDAAAYGGNVLDRWWLEPILTSMTEAIDPGGRLVRAGGLGEASASAQCIIAPALMLRERVSEGLAGTLGSIAERIQRNGRIPSGVVPLVDPDHIPPVLPSDEPGAVVEIDGEKFLPMPANDTQRKIVDRVDTHAHVVVQGPPGTGKTHLIAMLLTHLLAQGKRVLVTAQTDKALAQVRAMMPDSVRPLAVSVLNTATDNAAELKEAVEHLANESLADDPAARRYRIDRHLSDLDRMAADRRRAYDELIAARAQETRRRPESGIDDTLVGIRRTQEERADECRWVLPYFTPGQPAPAITNADLHTYRKLSLQSRRFGAESVYLIEHALPDPTEFAQLALRREEAARRVRQFRDKVGGRWAKSLLSLPPVQRKEFGTTLQGLRTTVNRLRQSNSPWVPAALDDVLSGSSGTWSERRGRLTELHSQAKQSAEAIGTSDEVIVDGDISGLEPLAVNLRDYVLDTAIKVDSAGRPKGGFLTPRPVKAAHDLFARVTVNGHAPVTENDLNLVIGHLGLARLLRLLDQEWNRVTTGSTTQRLREHAEELRLLTELTDFSAQLGGINDWFERQGWELPDWRQFRAGNELIATVSALPDLEHEKSARRAIEKLRKQTAAEANTPRAAECVRALHAAVERGDVQAYTKAYQENLDMLDTRDGDSERSRLRRMVEQISPRLAMDLADPSSASDQEWGRRLDQLDRAWSWARTQVWLDEQTQADAEPARQRVAVLENEITTSVERLAAERAWGHALDPSRITPSTRASLMAYSQQVRQLGKGTGRYAARLRGEIRDTMRQCRDAVPVWILPLYRVIEQIEPVEDSFDVVIVDEASQAGMETLFLHCLAPRIVVVGDDKQVSPAGVGQDRQQLRDLVRRHLPDHQHAQLWANPMRSLFDEATMRYGGRLILTEHHRSVPDIIEFSNREFYEPDGIRLELVRQFARSRLDPIRTIHVPNATLESNDVNRAEVDTIVGEIERCIADPRYGGLTFGVVTLLGSAQARAIESELMRRIPVQEWSRRQLLCGEAPAFQGSERDVMFVSMVAAPSGRRLIAQTQEVIAQRYNVALTRARDQVVLVHSVQPAQLTNATDLRYRLLNYCTTVARAGAHRRAILDPVPTDVLVPPFDSILEQQIYNLLVRDDYFVKVQHELLGFRIDLVVEGEHGSLAIECEDDTWEGEQEYARQLRRRRELEACGWRFVTVRRSDFDIDPGAAYAKVEEALHELGIEPIEADPIPRRASSFEGDSDDIVDDPIQAGEIPFGPEWQAAEDQAPALGSLPRAAELEDYHVFHGDLPDPLTVPLEDVMEAVLGIVAAEGPVTGSRLEQAYADAAGWTRVPARQRTQLGMALSALANADRVVAENPRDVADWHEHAFRLPDQPWSRARLLGPRRLEQVPLPEVALLLDIAQYQVGEGGTEDDRHRVVLRRLGLSRLDERIRRFLRTADELG